MKNITVSVDDEIYRQVRIKAAENSTSVSALVKRFFNEVVERESDFDRRKRLQRETLASIRAFRASDRLPREALHQRHALS